MDWVDFCVDKMDTHGMGKATVIFNLREGTIEVRGPSDDLALLFRAVREAAPALKDIRVITTNNGLPVAQEAADLDDGPAPTARPLTAGMYKFAATHPAANHSERIALLAYFATRIRGGNHFSADDMEAWFMVCGFKMPASMSYAMADAQRKDGYIENQGRNQWVLTAKGERLVAQLVERDDGSP